MLTPSYVKSLDLLPGVKLRLDSIPVLVTQIFKLNSECPPRQQYRDCMMESGVSMLKSVR